MYRIARLLLWVLSIHCAVGSFCIVSDPCRSGLEPGQRPGPYSAVISTGPERGQAHCYICATAERPAVIVFARTLSAPLAQLAVQLDRAVRKNEKSELRSWITFLNSDQIGLDPKLVAWSRENSLRSLPLGVFEDPDGPPSYRLSRDADVTVLFSVKEKVVANFAFRAGELNGEGMTEMMKTLPRILSAKR